LQHGVLLLWFVVHVTATDLVPARTTT